MKLKKSILALLIGAQFSAFSQNPSEDTPALPGDQFSLAGALEMFKKAPGPEDFEKLINSENNQVNNLDLNEDGKTDYVRVINRQENNVHIFVLQAIISDHEYQDIAVIELEKNGAETAVIQIVGDEDIFGEETIVEPTSEESTASYYDSYSVPHGPNVFREIEYNNLTTTEAGIIINVWAWPSVRFVYSPRYTLWVSPATYRALPGWYRPWRPLSWSAFRPIRYQRYPAYIIVPSRRIVRAPLVYRPHRVTSVTVRTRNHVAVTNYRATRTRSTVTTTRGNRQYKATRRTTTVKGPNGKATRTRTTVKRKR